ncbi:MAG: hypothetical protein ABL890_02050 [Candidatus Peribacteraceae bacterium]
MMITTFDVVLAHIQSSTVLQIFLVSNIILVVGMSILVWLYAVRLTHVQNMPLNVVEFTHPQLPKLDIILLILFSHACILLAVMIALLGAGPFTGPYAWIGMTSALLISAALSMFAELKKRGSRAYASGVALGTSVALFIVVIRLLFAGKPLTETVIAVLFLFGGIAGSLRLLGAGRAVARSIVVACIAAFVWFMIFSLPA